MKMFVILLMISTLLTPVAHAQQRIQINNDLLPTIPYTIPHYPIERIFAIGIGAFLGVTVIPIFLEGISYTIGGLLIGGILGNYWYETGFWPLRY